MKLLKVLRRCSVFSPFLLTKVDTNWRKKNETLVFNVRHRSYSSALLSQHATRIRETHVLEPAIIESSNGEISHILPVLQFTGSHDGQMISIFFSKNTRWLWFWHHGKVLKTCLAFLRSLSLFAIEYLPPLFLLTSLAYLFPTLPSICSAPCTLMT